MDETIRDGLDSLAAAVAQARARRELIQSTLAETMSQLRVEQQQTQSDITKIGQMAKDLAQQRLRDEQEEKRAREGLAEVQQKVKRRDLEIKAIKQDKKEVTDKLQAKREGEQSRTTPTRSTAKG